MKKILSLVLSLSIIFTYIVVVDAQGSVDWKIKNGVLTVYGTGEMTNYNNSQEAPFTKDKNSINEIVIKEGVTSVGDWAFADCENAKKITIPNSVKRIGNRAFYNCKNLDYIKVPANVKEIGNGAFNGCVLVKRVDLFDGLEVIGDSAFMNLPKLSAIIVPKTVKSLGNWTFFGNTSMKGIYFKGSVPEKLGNYIIDRINEDYMVYFNYETGLEWLDAEYFDENRVNGFEAENYIPVYLNNSMLNFDTDPIIENGRTLVPVRAIFEAMGAEVEWNGETRTVIAKKGDTIIEIPIKSDIIYKNTKAIKIDVPAKIENGRTLVPLRAISEAYGAKVEWDNSERSVNIFFE